MGPFISFIISSLLFIGAAHAQTTTVRGAEKGTSTAAPVTATSIDANHTALDVNLAGGSVSISGADGAILDGANATIRGTVKNLTNSNALATQIMDGSGNAITSFGGGTQYTEDVPSVADPIGNQIICRRRDSPATETTTDGDNTAANCTSKGELLVKHLDAISVNYGSGTFLVGDGSGPLTIDGTVTANQGGAPWTVKPDGTVWTLTGTSANANVTNSTLAVTQSGTWTVQPGNTANTTAWKVDGSAVTQPVSGTITANAGTNLNTSALALDATLTGRINAAAALADNTANPTAGAIGVYVMCFDGTTWDRCRGTTIDTDDNLIATAQSSSLVITENYDFDGTNWVRELLTSVAHNAAPPAAVSVPSCEQATQTSTQPTAGTAGNQRRVVCSTDGNFYVRPHGPVIWSCGLNGISTTLTQCQAAPGAGLRLYITDVITQSSTATAGLFTLRFGTGSNCGTGTGNLFFASASALMASPANTSPVNDFHLTTPIAVTANNAICVLGVATNTTDIQINGYTAP